MNQEPHSKSQKEQQSKKRMQKKGIDKGKTKINELEYRKRE